uniref:Stomatin (EPB72)-like 3a n=1 Tax=Labrus bergylta TaxID=56723 RepID=A0A3Q3GZW8_9LABR
MQTLHTTHYSNTAFISLSSDKNSGRLGCFGWILVIFSLLFIGVTFPITLFMCVKIVNEYERAVIFRLGRITDRKPKGPGLFFVLPCTDNFVKVDLRTVSFDIPPQEILTRDSVTVCVDGVVYFRIHCPISSVANVSNAHSSTRLLAQTTLRNVLGTKNLAELLSDREGISLSMQESLDEATDPWGIKVERVEARAKIIAAEGEMNASRALKEASLVIAESPSALQLRYLQTLNAIAAEKNSTIIFPLPIDVISNFMQRKTSFRLFRSSSMCLYGAKASWQQQIALVKKLHQSFKPNKQTLYSFCPVVTTICSSVLLRRASSNRFARSLRLRF